MLKTIADALNVAIAAIGLSVLLVHDLIEHLQTLVMRCAGQ